MRDQIEVFFKFRSSRSFRLVSENATTARRRGRIRLLLAAAVCTAPTQKKEFLLVSDLPQFTEIIDAIVMPLIGAIALLLAKLSQGDAARWAERRFFVTLVVITLVTLRTVIVCNEFWLVHTATLGTLIVGALVIPGHSHYVTA